jgi:hypothetical protein
LPLLTRHPGQRRRATRREGRLMGQSFKKNGTAVWAVPHAVSR